MKQAMIVLMLVQAVLVFGTPNSDYDNAYAAWLAANANSAADANSAANTNAAAAAKEVALEAYAAATLNRIGDTNLQAIVRCRAFERLVSDVAFETTAVITNTAVIRAAAIQIARIDPNNIEATRYLKANGGLGGADYAAMKVQFREDRFNEVCASVDDTNRTASVRANGLAKLAKRLDEGTPYGGYTNSVQLIARALELSKALPPIRSEGGDKGAHVSLRKFIARHRIEGKPRPELAELDADRKARMFDNLDKQSLLDITNLRMPKGHPHITYSKQVKAAMVAGDIAGAQQIIKNLYAARPDACASLVQEARKQGNARRR